MTTSGWDSSSLPTITRHMVEKLGAVYAPAYQEALPFPHWVIDGFLPDDYASRVAQEFPAMSWAGWKRHIHANSQKFACNAYASMGVLTQCVLDALNSLPVVNQIGRLLGCDVMDDRFTLEGGGMHLIPKGGFLGIHADFNVHPNGLWMRAANLLLYLHDSDGGDLELWAQDGSKCVRSIPTGRGRAVLFTTTDGSLHGHPNPLISECRKSLATYYYIPRPEGVKPHTTLYKERVS